MSLSPRIIVHSLDHARIALAAAQAAGRGVTLESPPGAAGYQGIGWWRALVEQLGREFADLALNTGALDAVLDCGSAPGHALAALRAGVPAMRLAAEPSVLARLREMAAQAGSVIQDGAPHDTALDLVNETDPAAAVAAFLATGPRSDQPSSPTPPKIV